MTLHQVEAVNNAMSFLAILSTELIPTYTYRMCKDLVQHHVKILKEAGVNNNIINHFNDVCFLILKNI